MDREENLDKVIEDQVELLGFEMVKFDMASSGKRKVLRIYIDRPEAKVSIDDCVKVTRSLGLLLEDDDLVKGPFNLEVTSPGINRPLTKPEHYIRFVGKEARVETIKSDGARTTIIGTIKACDGSKVVIDDGKKEEEIEIDNIIKARLHGEKWDISKKKGKRR